MKPHQQEQSTNPANGAYQEDDELTFDFSDIDYDIAGDDTDTSTFTVQVGANDGTADDYDTSDDELTYDTDTSIFTFTVPSGVTDSDGIQYTYTVVDQAGNERSLDATLTGVTVDTTLPTAPTIDLDTASDTGVSTTDNITADTTPSFTITNYATVTAADTVTVSWLVDGTVQAGQTASTFTPATALTDGEYDITARFTDTADNTVDSAVLTVTIDTTGPTAPVVDLDAASDTGIATDNITADTTPSFTITNYTTVTADDTVTVSWFVDGTVQANQTGSTFTPATALTDGEYDITARFTDQTLKHD